MMAKQDANDRPKYVATEMIFLFFKWNALGVNFHLEDKKQFNYQLDTFNINLTLRIILEQSPNKLFKMSGEAANIPNRTDS